MALSYNTKAVIFDVDGVIIDSEPLWQGVMQTVFQEFGIDYITEFSKRFMGVKTENAVAIIFTECPWISSTQERVISRIIESVIRKVEQYGTALPGVAQVHTLARSLGYKTAVASSSSDSIIAAVLKKLDLQDWDVIYSAEHEKFGKPDPAVYLTTAKKLGVLPSECIAFEDSVNGVVAAKAADMRCIAIPDIRYTTKEDVDMADVVVDSLENVTKEMIEAVGDMKR